ncbi:MAG: hypothetical protein ACK4IS_13330 [Erythrobacter sp.]
MSDGQPPAAAASAPGAPPAPAPASPAPAPSAPGGAADLLKPQGGGDAAGGQGGGAAAGGSEPWFNVLSDKPSKNGAKSHREWMANKGYADIDTAISSFRELEARFLAGDKLVLPKEGDAPEVIDAFHKAIGRPDAPDGYEIPAIEGGEIDQGLADRMRQAAFKAGVPKNAFEALVQEFNQYGKELIEQAGDAAINAKKEGSEALRREWGDKFAANVSHANKAMTALELDADYVTRMEAGLGTADTMKLLAKIGMGIGEDALIGGGSGRFQMSKAEAQAELASMKEGEKAQKLIKGDPDLTARRKMLLNIVSQHEALEAQRAAAS